MPRRGDRKRVVVVGAGVAGMTCAHELVERGFEVEVVEMAADPYDATVPCIGGMARTSWGRVPPPYDQVPVRFVGTDPRPAVTGSPRAWLPIVPDRSPFAIRVPLDALVTSPADTPPGALQEARDAIAAFLGALDVQDTLSVIASRKLLADEKQRVTTALRGRPWHLIVSSPTADGSQDWAQVSVERSRVPGEHGFRFFPSFYRHLFDTMKRIPIAQAAIGGSPDGAVLTSDSPRSVFDALRSAEVIQLALAPDARGRSRTFEIPRRPLHSPGDLRKLFADVLERAGYRGQDLLRLATRYAEYLTSSPERRRCYEDMSWAGFLGLDGGGFSQGFMRHVTSGAQALVAMSSQTNDARTIGSIAIQLTLDQIRANPSGYTDATLRGPTSLELFAPWRAYLESQSVAFTRAQLVGFYGRGMAVRPAFGLPCKGGFQNASIDPADYYVVTIPVDKFQALFDREGRPAAALVGGGPQLLSSGELRAANRQCIELDRLEQSLEVPAGESADDVAKYLEFGLGDTARAPDGGPMRYMCGIQFYFESDIKDIVGHALCLDSVWGVSHISQVQYWQDRARGQSGVRGVLSVIFTIFEKPAPDRNGDDPRTALACTADEIAERIWAQLLASWDAGRFGPLPDPDYYYLDENLTRDDASGQWTNATPYLVNRVGDWPKRGGVRIGDNDYHYRMQLGHAVFAGAFMRTSTRLNTMEAANESGRRAANAILDYEGSLQQRAQLWSLEGHELAEASAMRELDRRIFRRGGHHVLRHAGVEAALRVIPWDLMRLGLPTQGEDP
jgi:hypothetical protein